MKSVIPEIMMNMIEKLSGKKTMLKACEQRLQNVIVVTSKFELSYAS